MMSCIFYIDQLTERAEIWGIYAGALKMRRTVRPLRGVPTSFDWWWKEPFFDMKNYFTFLFLLGSLIVPIIFAINACLNPGTQSKTNPHPGEMKCPTWWNTHQVLAHSSAVTPNPCIEHCLRVAETIIIWFPIRCFFLNKDYKLLKWRITRRHALLGNAPFAIMTPKSSTRTSEMNRKEYIASFRLPSEHYWLFIPSKLCYLRIYEFWWNSWQ